MNVLSSLRILVAAVALAATSLAPSTADAGWLFRNLGRGFFARVNDSGHHDGWYYVTAFANGCLTYNRHSLISSHYGTASNAVNYGPDWKSDLVKALDRQKDNELFIQAVRESGLKGAGAGYSGVSGLDYTAYGTTIVNKGFPYAEQGGTVYGLAAYAPNIGQVDIAGILQQQGRIVEQVANVTGQANNSFSDRVEQVSAAQTEIAKLQEAGRIIVETVKATATPVQATHQWQLQSNGTGEVQATEHSGDSGEFGGVGLQSVPPSGAALALVKTQVHLSQHCGKCHSGDKPKGGLDLTNLSSWSPEVLREKGTKVLAAIATGEMPPKDSNVPALNADQFADLVHAFRR